MNRWLEEMLNLVAGGAAKEQEEVFGKIEGAARALGFDYCSYGLQLPFPLTNPKIFMVSNYPAAWCERYAEAGYLAIDPTVEHGRRTTAPLVWTDAVFRDTPELWAEARSHGLRVGWAQSCLDDHGGGGMLSLARGSEPITQSELDCNQTKMIWLASVAHVSLSRVLREKYVGSESVELSKREAEVLKWHADGKTLSEISEILTISVDTVKFHTKNAVMKLRAANKTAAVIRAVLLGLLH